MFESWRFFEYDLAIKHKVLLAAVSRHNDTRSLQNIPCVIDAPSQVRFLAATDRSEDILLAVALRLLGYLFLRRDI